MMKLLLFMLLLNNFLSMLHLGFLNIFLISFLLLGHILELIQLSRTVIFSFVFHVVWFVSGLLHTRSHFEGRKVSLSTIFLAHIGSPHHWVTVGGRRISHVGVHIKGIWWGIEVWVFEWRWHSPILLRVHLRKTVSRHEVWHESIVGCCIHSLFRRRVRKGVGWNGTILLHTSWRTRGCVVPWEILVGTYLEMIWLWMSFRISFLDALEKTRSFVIFLKD